MKAALGVGAVDPQLGRAGGPGCRHAQRQGIDIEPDQQRHFGFSTASLPAEVVIQSLDGIIASAGKATVLAVDQVDGIVAVNTSQPDNGLSNAELNLLANGLMDLAQRARHTLVIPSCIVATWRRLQSAVVASAAARYREIGLYSLPSPEIGQALIAAHFARGFADAGFTPPYRTWPILPEAFRGAKELSPRSLMELVDKHIRKCRLNRRVEEARTLADDMSPTPPVPLTPVPPIEPSRIKDLDAEFASARLRAAIDSYLDEHAVDAGLPALLQCALSCWIDENEARGEFIVDPKPGRSPTIHARLRQIIDRNTEAELHWAFRAVHNENAVAALNRLRTAITRSGLELRPPKRQLVILRNQPWSRGPTTQQVVAEFTRLGGETIPLDTNDLRTFVALAELRASHGEAILPWLKSTRPASKTRLLASIFSDGLTTVGEPRRPAAPPVPFEPATTAGADPSAGGIAPEIVIGTSTEDGRHISLKLEDLRRHIAIFAGSGSGKTVLVRRLVEACALAGVSSIVLDPNNDLARLGLSWPQTPEGWLDGDAERARFYHERTEVIIWTPRRTTGRPLSFQPISDLAAVKDDPDEFAMAIDNAVATLLPRAGLPRSGAKADQGQAVLRQALTQFTREGGSGLTAFLAYFRDLPDGVSAEFSDARKLAHDMTQTLLAATINDPLFGGGGEPVDPGALLTPSPGKAARVSVISLIGLPNDDQRQSFVNQLQMALFSWAKQNPAGERPLGGLYVMDEAQTFAPASPVTACTLSTLTLAAQARKYGLGLIFATQAPKGLHNRIAGNAATQFYGFLNAPAQIQAVREIAAAKGGDVPDISRLRSGTFYVGSDLLAPQKVATPMCLSLHPRSPLSPMEVLTLASANRG